MIAHRVSHERADRDWHRLDDKRKMMLMQYTEESFEQALFYLWQEEIEQVGVIDWPRAGLMRYLFGAEAEQVTGWSLPTLDIPELKMLAFKQAYEQAGTILGAGRLCGISAKTANNYMSEVRKNEVKELDVERK